MLVMSVCAVPGCGKSKTAGVSGKEKVAMPTAVAPTNVAPVVVGEPPMWNGGILGVAGPSHDEVEPNDDRATAMPLPLGTSVSASLATAEDVDVYRVHVDARGALRVALEAMAKTDSTLEIADAQGTVLANFSIPANATLGAQTIVVTFQSGPPPQNAPPPSYSFVGGLTINP